MGRKIKVLDREKFVEAINDYCSHKITMDEAAKKNGYTIKAFHGTSRADRVGNVFLPERATSGPMAFFTDNREVAERYSRDKADTSLAYDPDFDQYETQFRIKAGKLDVELVGGRRMITIGSIERYAAQERHAGRPKKFVAVQ